jgi:hypothetical protein
MDILTLKNATIRDVAVLDEGDGSFKFLQLHLDDGRKVKFTSIDNTQDSSCAWHQNKIDYEIE